MELRGRAYMWAVIAIDLCNTEIPEEMISILETFRDFQDARAYLRGREWSNDRLDSVVFEIYKVYLPE